MSEDSSIALLAALVVDSEKALALPAGFLKTLRDEDDWSFVIKAHAVIEAAMTHALTSALRDDRLRGPFSQLDLSGVRAGKIAFAEALDIVSSDQRRFIRRLSELRNTLVHDIRNVTFTFEEYIGRLNADQKRSFAEAFDIARPADGAAASIVLTNPKSLIWLGVILITLAAYRVKAERDFQERIGRIRDADRSEEERARGPADDS